MADKQYLINREELFKAFGNPRTVLQFEEFQRRFGTVETQTTVAVAATEALKDGTFLTLSANAELTNERVLSLGDGLAYTLGPGTFVLGLSDEAARTNGFRVTFAAAGDSSVAVPLTGRLATEEWVNSQGFSTGGGSGTVTSVALTVPSGLSVSGSPVTTTGTLAISTTLSGYVKGNGSGFTAAATIPTTDFSGTLQAAQFPALTGDVTTAGGALATTIAADAVTYAKMQNVSAASRLLGRGDSGAGDPQEITLGTNLSMSGTTLNATGGGGGVNSGKTTVDFGAFPGASDAKVTITGQAGILTTSKVKAYLMAEATADHTADEHWIEQIEVMAGNIVAATGFDIYARCTATLSEPAIEGWADTRLAGPGTGSNQVRPSRSAGLLPRIYGQFTVAWEWV